MRKTPNHQNLLSLLMYIYIYTTILSIKFLLKIFVLYDNEQKIRPLENPLFGIEYTAHQYQTPKGRQACGLFLRPIPIKFL